MVSRVLSSAPSLGKTGNTMLYLNINMHNMFFKFSIYKPPQGGGGLFISSTLGRGLISHKLYFINEVLLFMKNYIFLCTSAGIFLTKLTSTVFEFVPLLLVVIAFIILVSRGKDGRMVNNG